MKILQLDKNHPLIMQQLAARGFIVEENFTCSYQETLNIIGDYDGIILRSRIPIDRTLITKAKNLKFIARVGAGLENINVEFAKENNISIISSPEGNRDSVAEHVLGMILVIMHRLFISSNEIKNGIWLREENRGDELLGKTFGIIGYGNMGKAVAKRLSGFGVKVIFYDILPNIHDQFAEQVSLETLKRAADIISLHLPETPGTFHFVDQEFISSMKKNFYFINTARGKNVNTSQLVEGLKTGKVKGACLDVLEYEKSSFENIEIVNEDLQYLLSSEKVIITPHIAGWTVQSKEKLAQFIVDKIVEEFPVR